jgi:S1-C subfamily serine protease
VKPGGAAAHAGLRAGKQRATLAGVTYPLGGDLIDSAEGIQLSSIDQLREAIAGKKPGDKVELGVYRGDKHQTVTVKLGRQPTS